MSDEARHSRSGPGKHAVGVDPKIKSANLNRLRRIEGQVRGLQRMVEEDRYCADILIQVSAVHEALRKVSRGLLENHLRHCASHAIQHSPQKADAMYSELLDLFTRHSR
jgi:CsoR family transcriptional regulator, copper-sensing transcriptional repressor